MTKFPLIADESIVFLVHRHFVCVGYGINLVPDVSDALWGCGDASSDHRWAK